MSHFYERISKKKINYEEEISKLQRLLNEERVVEDASTILDKYCFRRLKLSGNYISLNEMIVDVFTSVKNLSDQFIHLSELLLSLVNQMNLSMIPYSSDRDFIRNQLSSIENLIIFDLNKLNLEAKLIENEYGEIAIIGPKSELLEVALESVKDEKVETRLIEYNSLSLRGKTDSKESILCSLYSFVEGYLKDNQLAQMNKRLFENVDFLYNNLNMKHNNKECNDTFFYESTLDNREEWLDNLFHCVLMVIASKKEKDINNGITQLKNLKKSN